jgi:uncharacterized protein YyaL (SSP411 family)
MLYDNALLIMAYLEAYQVTGDKDFKRITNEILRYVERDMTSPDGAFYSATDADSLTPSGHREEGYYFTWTPQELVEALGQDRARVVSEYYSVDFRGNFEGRSILNTPKTTREISERLNISEKRLRDIIEESNEILYQARAHRPPPLRDEKILTAWNGLMISAHAQAGLTLGNPQYVLRAIRAAQLHNAYLDDYAFFIAALLDLHEATHELQWLQKAIEMDAILENNYEDMKNGGFFMTSNDHEKLLAREKPSYDGAVPSGNSIAVQNLLRLYEFTTKESYRTRSEKALQSFSSILASNPGALSEMLLAVDFYFDSPKEVIIVAPRGKEAEAEPFLSVFRKQFLPNRILTVVTEGEDLESYSGIIPLVQDKIALAGKVTAYVCEGGTCKLPTSDPLVFSQQIKTVKKLTQL